MRIYIKLAAQGVNEAWDPRPWSHPARRECRQSSPWKGRTPWSLDAPAQQEQIVKNW